MKRSKSPIRINWKKNEIVLNNTKYENKIQNYKTGMVSGGNQPKRNFQNQKNEERVCPYF